MQRPRPKFKVSFYLYFCCFWINVTQINFENIKRKIQRITSDSCFQLKSWCNVDAKSALYPTTELPLEVPRVHLGEERVHYPLHSSSFKFSPPTGSSRPNVMNGNSENANGKLPDTSRVSLYLQINSFKVYIKQEACYLMFLRNYIVTCLIRWRF